MKFLLASNSPRRKELLSELGYDFEIIKINVDETFPPEIPISEIAKFISEKKANICFPKPDEIILTADTTVALENQILLKPKSKEEAFEMLKNLSGKTHQVYTAFTLKTFKNQISKTQKTYVEFSEMDNEEIRFYVENFKPFDKAGSYGIQEWLGMAKIKSISGSYYSVMGLPVDLIYEELKKLNHFPHKFQNKL